MAERSSNLGVIERAFAEYDRGVILNNVKVGCFLGMLLMPVGIVLDFFVYPHDVVYFLKLRLLCSALISVFWAVVVTPLGQKHSRKLGALLFMFPTFFISWMIYATDGSTSPYYAGLNLLLLAIGYVLHWTFYESVVAVGMVMIMYLSACLLHSHQAGTGFLSRLLANNLYFMALTGIIVVTGSYVQSRARFREFQLRYELDQSRGLLEASNEKLKELDQVKNRFFANISHELRTPLTLLLSPLETMLNSRNRQIDADSRNLMTIMHGNGMRLLKLINDLLDLVRLESGRMEVRREPLEMNAYLRGLIGAAQQMADAKGLKLSTWVEPELGAVLADRDKLEKTILNLVFNALKFTPTGGSVTVRVQKQEEKVAITVADTGVGISAKNLPFVFDRFWQADGSSKRKYQGVGIGLSLVKELTEIQGGKVSAESQEGKGTTFTVLLPFLQPESSAVSGKEERPAEPGTAATPELEIAAVPAPGAAAEPTKTAGVQSEEWLANLYRRAELFPATAPSEDAAQPVEAAKNGSLSTILVADDEPDMLRFLKSQLNTHYHVVEASDGLQAFERAGKFLPDIILLDMNMPEKDGLQVCRELREQASTQGIPIVILTARADEATKLSALSAGANDFLTKPFSSSELHVRIKNLVDAHHYKEKLAKQKVTLENTIEQLKETESMLVQTEKMASLGRMSAGIIHEINNPLNYATTGLYTLRNKDKYLAPEQQEEYREVLHDVEEGLGRVKDIVSGLRVFSHPDVDQVDYVEALGIFDSALEFLSSEWKGKVRIEKKLDPRQTVKANKNKLLQVFVNLLQNSLDALKQKTLAGDGPAIWIEGRVENGKSVLTLRDNGQGIDAKTINKVFDPFFTTKDVGEGMGLGLSICHRIVREYGGRISVRSEQGKFTEFTMEFPAAVDAARADKLE